MNGFYLTLVTNSRKMEIGKAWFLTIINNWRNVVGNPHSNFDFRYCLEIVFLFCMEQSERSESKWEMRGYDLFNFCFIRSISFDLASFIETKLIYSSWKDAKCNQFSSLFCSKFKILVIMKAKVKLIFSSIFF